MGKKIPCRFSLIEAVLQSEIRLEDLRCFQIFSVSNVLKFEKYRINAIEDIVKDLGGIQFFFADLMSLNFGQGLKVEVGRHRQNSLRRQNSGSKIQVLRVRGKPSGPYSFSVLSSKREE